MLTFLAKFLSDVCQKSQCDMRHLSFTKLAKSMWKTSQLLGTIVVWSTRVKPGNTFVGELAAVVLLKNSINPNQSMLKLTYL